LTWSFGDFFKFQIWRFVTNFFFLGKLGFGAPRRRRRRRRRRWGCRGLLLLLPPPLLLLLLILPNRAQVS